MHNNITGPWDNLFHFTPETTTVLITVAVLGVTAYLTINRTFFSRKTTVATLNKTGDRVIADRIMLNEQIKHHKLPICFTNLVDGDSEFLGLLTNNENDYISSLVFKSSTITNETIKLLLQFNNLKSVTFIDCHNINDSDLSELKKFEVKTKNCKQIHDVTTPGIPEGETTSKLIS